MDNVQLLKPHTRISKVRSPAEAFTQCPYCEGFDLLKFEGQVFCGSCDWNSLGVHAEALGHVDPAASGADDIGFLIQAHAEEEDAQAEDLEIA